jgi:type I restriction enzyme, S subunit
MTIWKEYKLGELLGKKGYLRGPFGSALKRPEMKKEGYAVYEQQHAIYNTRDFRYFIDSDKYSELNRFSVLPNDLIISCSGTVGEVSIITDDDPKGIISQALLTLRPNLELVKPKFLYYFFKTKNGHNQLLSASHGSVQVNIAKREIVETIPISVPNIKTQNSIIEILSSLDDKIELNNKINQELENLAQTLFKQWFIDFEFSNENGEPYKSSGGEMVESQLGEIPKGWEVCNLSDLLTVKYGKDHKHLADGPFPLYGSGGIMRYVENPLYSEPSILIPRKGTLSNLFYVSEPFWSVDTMFYTVIHNPAFGKYLFLSIKALNLASMNVGSAVPSMTTKVLNEIRLLKPDDKTMLDFDSQVSLFFEKIKHNISENIELSSLRDTLLPKLITGELQINELD